MGFSDSKMEQNQKKLFLTIILVSVVLIGKFIGAFMTNSLALFSDSWHLLTDLVAAVISWWGVKKAGKTANHRYTFGYYRFSILTALINNISLIMISIFILYKAVIRYLSPVTVEPGGMIIFALIGLVVNLTIVFNLRGASNNANIKSVFLHFAGDALADVGVLLGGIIIFFTGWHGIDTLLSAILACLILKSAIKMTIECVRIILEATPDGISIESLRATIKEIPGVIDVRDIHVWSLSMEKQAMTAHVCIEDKNFENYEKILHQIQHELKDKFNIEHSTIQIENMPCSSCFHSKPEHQTGCTMCIDCFT